MRIARGASHKRLIPDSDGTLRAVPRSVTGDADATTTLCTEFFFEISIFTPSRSTHSAARGEQDVAATLRPAHDTVLTRHRWSKIMCDKQHGQPNMQSTAAGAKLQSDFQFQTARIATLCTAKAAGTRNPCKECKSQVIECSYHR